MKKIILILAAAILAFASCSKDTYTPGPGGSGTGSGTGGGSTEPAARIDDGRVVIAYCTYYGKETPDYSRVTNINYSFAELYVSNGEYKGFKLQGAWDKYTDPEVRFKQILSVKKAHPEIKISLSFSHTVSNYDNAQGGGFSVMASTDKGRKAFAKDCLAFVKKWGIDGIDIDWEFPGLSWSGHACDPSIDTQNYTLLMKQLRETLGPDILLTYAGYVMDVQSITGGTKFIDIKAVDPYVDFVNIMTYDLTAGINGGHQSALYKGKGNYWDCERAVKAYIDAGVKPEKLVLGIPFYARHNWDNSDGYKGCVDFGDFATEYPASKGFKIDNWDEGWQVPYITKDGKLWAGYDNPKSIGIKADWARSKGLKGLMYWDYDADDSVGTLRKAVWESVMKK